MAYSFPTPYQPYNAYTASFNQRGNGRGRGYTYHPGRRAWIAPRPPYAAPVRPVYNAAGPQAGPHRKLVNNNQNGGDTGKSRSSQHRKLVNALPPPTTPTKVLSEVVINGVAFISDPKGRKLVRKEIAKAGEMPVIDDTPTAGPSTPSKVTVAGQNYIRTKSGNLIAKTVVEARAMNAKKKRLDGLVNTIKRTQAARSRHTKTPIQRKQTLCRFFTKTGECRNALTCAYLHDPNKLAICPQFIRKSCKHTETSCSLSHTPNANRMPHCLHFPECKHGDDCIFPHIHVATDAPVCREFASIGWCEKGGECPNRHVNECPEFSVSGTCSTKNCKLPHILRKKRDNTTAEPRTDVRPMNKRPATDDNNDDRINADAYFRPKRARTDGLSTNSDFITFDDQTDTRSVDEDMSSVDSEDFEHDIEDTQLQETEEETEARSGDLSDFDPSSLLY